MKSLNIICSKWWDKPNGNTYFTVKIIIDDSMVIFLPFQYGYENHYLTVTFDELEKMNLLPIEREVYPNGKEYDLYNYCKRNNIEFNHRSYYCKKREMLTPKKPL